MKLEKLTAKIQPHEIQWRVQSKGNGKTTVVPYLTNRCVMERFDEQFGADGWQNTFQEWRAKGVKCGISVKVESSPEWITKYDGADETNIESTKGGFSDSMKRAAVQWGLGRDLYDYPMVQISGEHKYIPRSIEPQLANLAEQVSSGRFNGNYILLSDNATAPVQKQSAPVKPKAKPVLSFGTPTFTKCVDWILADEKRSINDARQYYEISEEVEDEIKKVLMAMSV